MDYLNDQERDKLITFNQDEVMREAVKKVLLAGVTQNGTLQAGKKPNFKQNFAVDMNNTDDSDEILGRKMRTKVEGIRVVEFAFDQLLEFKPPKPPKKVEGNRAL